MFRETRTFTAVLLCNRSYDFPNSVTVFQAIVSGDRLLNMITAFAVSMTS